ncbi:cytotoxic translational repressor of toxin-antitoxin stability system [Desulfolutivibrio sulfoxidireducens]|uniref:cytotoxic translational repressor of toxin-antitoxin stability system n=1 Tax=Desulfolutivibrio sulfoxidireducens TaxID=2773299 RepID=UPI00159E49E0|nr:cytotoxic translational repressor of toxin-antitoxin stability system [Desulfolutivibrio sulfoxidireducens]QLA16618.1 cytotoxic translational repressor of toxin-antitoxin stability system [Desulfolutivibrio sulfoxidireducens]
MSWTVTAHKGVRKRVERIPETVRARVFALLLEIERAGPIRGNWPNYGKLGPRRHHCHIKKGRPTYVAVWEESEQSVRLVEVTYVGTHEKAPC